MATEDLKEYRQMATDQLQEREQELRTQLFKLRTNSATEKVKDVSQFKKVKKDIARILTVMRENELKAKKA
ncbi:MAG: 50S ribosomal protein L29 [Phycisphaerales bacterium]|nr:50S ribosomal protein L29 [Phycisphaerales bacterium]